MITTLFLSSLIEKCEMSRDIHILKFDNSYCWILDSKELKQMAVAILELRKLQCNDCFNREVKKANKCL